MGDAAWDPATLQPWVKTTEMFLLAISYAWGTPEHPDPECLTKNNLADTLKKRFAVRYDDGTPWVVDAGVFFDWCSLYQKKRNTVEEEDFKKGLKYCNLWYVHREIEVWLLTKSYPGVNPYDIRGWPTFEKGVSSMIKPSHRLFDLGQAPKQGDWGKLYFEAKTGRLPPMEPGAFGKLLASKIFANDSDVGKVADRYEITFKEVMGKSEQLSFVQNGWGNEEAKVLGRALPYATRMVGLYLSLNNIGAEGAETVCKGIAECKNLQVLSFWKNPLGPEGAKWVAWAMERLPRLMRLDVKECGLGDAGALHIASAWPKCKTLKELIIKPGNNISPEVFQKLKSPK